MRINGLRKYYSEKRLKEKEKQLCSDNKMNNRLSFQQINKSDIKKPTINYQRTSIKENIYFNELNSKQNIKRNLFDKFQNKENKENKENNIPNENTNESKDTQENSIKHNLSNINYSNSNYGYSRNNYFNKRYNLKNRFTKNKLRLSTPIVFENNYKTNDENVLIKKEKCFKINYLNHDSIFDGEIDDLINSTTSKIENEKEQKNQDDYEFKKYLEQVKKLKLSKNNLTKGTLALIQMQISHAKDAVLNNKYISYINIETNKEDDNEKNNICFRIGKNNMCVCGHSFSRHNLYQRGSEFISNCKKCVCNKFKYIPIFPEETNEYTKAYLLDFKYDDWKAGCKCGHNWTYHNFNKGEKCEECNCAYFKSNFSCGVCGNSWENHITLFETKEERKKYGKTIDSDYEPFTQEEIENILNN